MFGAADPRSPRPSAAILVLGWGNELRGDDAAGRQVARRVAAWAPDGVRVLEAHQLLPEFAEAVAAARQVIFVDARADAPDEGVRIGPVGREPGAADGGGLGHACGPERILALAEQIYGARPEAWLVSVPGRKFEVGRPMGRAARAAAKEAEAGVRALVDGGTVRREP